MKQRKMCYVNSNQEETGMGITILDKIKRQHYILTKDQLRRHNTPNIRTPKYMKQH